MKKLLVFITAGFCLSVAFLHAADRTWENTETNFNNGGSWEGDAAPGTGDRAVFSPVAVFNPNLSSSTTIQGLIFGQIDVAATAAGGGYILSGDPGAILTLTNAGTHKNARPIYHRTLGSNTISAPIIFGASGTGSHQEVELINGNLTFAGNLTGQTRVVSISVSSGALATLEGVNDFQAGFTATNSGALTITNASGLDGNGTLSLGNVSNLSAPVTNSSGATIHSSFDDLRIGGNTSSGYLVLAGNDWDFGSGTVTLTGPRTVNISGTTRATFGGAVGEDVADRRLMKNGTGTLELQAASTYTGRTEIQDGLLLLTNSGTISTGNLQLRGGVLGLGTGDFTRELGSGINQVQWLGGGGFSTAGGFAAIGADRIVNLGGASDEMTWGGSFAGSNLTLGSADADATVDFQNPIDISGAGATRTFKVNDGSADVDGILSGVISGSQSIEKTGDGTLAMTAANTYTGNTTVVAGRLLVNDSIASSFTTVQSGGALGGSGSVNNISLNTGGAVTPGNSIGILEGTSLTWDGEADDSFGQMQFELSNTDNTSDQLDLSGNFTKGSGSFFIFDFLGTGAADQTYTLVNFGSTDFVVDDFEYIGLASGLSGEFTLDGSSLQISVIPEPGTFTMLIIGFCGLVFAMKRRRR